MTLCLGIDAQLGQKSHSHQLYKHVRRCKDSALAGAQHLWEVSVGLSKKKKNIEITLPQSM